MRVLTAADGEVLGLGFSPAGDALAATVDARGVFLWNLAAGSATPVRLDTVASPYRNRHLFFAPDGRSVAWLGTDGRKVYDRDSRRTVLTRLDTPGRPLRMTQTPDGQRLVTQHNFPDPQVVGWRPEEGHWVRWWSVSTKDMPVHDLAVSPDGGRMALLVREPRGTRLSDFPIRLELRSAATGRTERTGPYPYTCESPLTFSPDGGQLVAVRDMTLLVWPVPELGEPRVVRNDTRKHFTAAAYHPSGRYLFATSNDATVHVFDTASWARAGRFTWNVGRLRSVAVSPDGSLAAAGGDTGEVVVWDVDL